MDAKLADNESLLGNSGQLADSIVIHRIDVGACVTSTKKISFTYPFPLKSKLLEKGLAHSPPYQPESEAQLAELIKICVSKVKAWWSQDLSKQKEGI